MIEQLIWVDHILAILLGIFFPFLSLQQSQKSLPSSEFWDTNAKINFYKANSGFLWILAFVVIILFWLTDRTISLEFSWNNQLIILLGIAATLYFFETGLSHYSLEKAKMQLLKTAPFLPSKKVELFYYFILAISAGICEEIVFRGFLLNYFIAFFQNITLAIIVSTFLFAIVHIYQGIKAVGKIFVFSLIFALLFLWSESLLLPIILHVLVDVISGISAFLILSKSQN
jgi:membrane protease YdiL (CAAX protease family)